MCLLVYPVYVNKKIFTQHLTAKENLYTTLLVSLIESTAFHLLFDVVSNFSCLHDANISYISNLV